MIKIQATRRSPGKSLILTNVWSTIENIRKKTVCIKL